jgi:midasin (ATPase involved in ribosome maturation)
MAVLKFQSIAECNKINVTEKYLYYSSKICGALELLWLTFMVWYMKLCQILKGFCTPAELSDEAEGEGATKFEDIEGGGLGDGEGTKDVSEQIESEDQVSWFISHIS